MKELELSKRALALRIGIDPPSLVKILNGTRRVGTAVLVKIHRNIPIDLNQLVDIDPAREFFDDDSPPPATSPSAQPGRSERHGALRSTDLNARSAPKAAEQITQYSRKARKARP